METEVLQGKGFVSDNQSPSFGTSGHEELTLSKHPDGTIVNYDYKVIIHKPWLRLVAGPLVGVFAMKFWKRAFIDELRHRLEK